jgi:hypothetical protein
MLLKAIAPVVLGSATVVVADFPAEADQRALADVEELRADPVAEGIVLAAPVVADREAVIEGASRATVLMNAYLICAV